MTKTVWNVEGMSCEHCAGAVTKAVSVLSGVDGVSVDLKAGTVTVDYDAGQCSPERIAAQIEEQGYEVKGLA